MGNYYVDLIEKDYLKGFNDVDIVGLMKNLNKGSKDSGFDTRKGYFDQKGVYYMPEKPATAEQIEQIRQFVSDMRNKQYEDLLLLDVKKK